MNYQNTYIAVLIDVPASIVDASSIHGKDVMLPKPENCVLQVPESKSDEQSISPFQIHWENSKKLVIMQKLGRKGYFCVCSYNNQLSEDRQGKLFFYSCHQHHEAIGRVGKHYKSTAKYIVHPLSSIPKCKFFQQFENNELVLNLR